MEPELWRLTPVKELALNSRGPGDPSEGPTEVDSPPQATSRASGSPPRLEVGVGAPSSCIVTAEDPRRTTPREGFGFPSDQDAFDCFGILAWSGFDPRARLDHLAVTPTPLLRVGHCPGEKRLCYPFEVPGPDVPSKTMKLRWPCRRNFLGPFVP